MCWRYPNNAMYNLIIICIFICLYRVQITNIFNIINYYIHFLFSKSLNISSLFASFALLFSFWFLSYDNDNSKQQRWFLYVFFYSFLYKQHTSLCNRKKSCARLGMMMMMKKFLFYLDNMAAYRRWRWWWFSKAHIKTKT